MAIPSFYAVKAAAIKVMQDEFKDEPKTSPVEVQWGAKKNPARVVVGLGDASISGDWGAALGRGRERSVEYRIEGFAQVTVQGGTQEDAVRDATRLFERTAAAFLKDGALTLGGLSRGVLVVLTQAVEWPTDRGYGCELQFDVVVPVVRTVVEA